MIGVANPVATQPVAQQAQPVPAVTYAQPIAQPAANQPMTDGNYGLAGSEQALTSAYNTGLGAINQYNDAANARLLEYRKAMNNRTLNIDATPSADVTNPINEAVGNFSGYMQTGNQASKMYSDLTGVNGPEAQAAAQEAYKNSPALQYQIDQMQKVTERSAAARGGLLGGRVALELQKNAQGLASQDYFKNLDAIGTLADRGITAAGQVGNLRSNQASIAGGLQQAKMQAQTQYEMQKEDIRNQIAGKLSNIAENTGLNIANLAGGYGSAIAAGRTTAGQNIADTAVKAAGDISKYLSDQGIQVSDAISKDISSIADMIYQGGVQDKTDMQNLAAILANINGGQASNVQSGYNTIGAAQAGGITGAANAVAGGVGNYLAYAQPKMSSGLPKANYVSDVSGANYSNPIA